MAKETPVAEESLWQASVRRFGEDGAKRLLADVKLGAYVPDLPPEYARASALAFREYIWPLVARPAQLPPSGAWDVWCFVGGRGTGKSRAASQFVVSEAERAAKLIAQGRLRREAAKIIVVGPTAADLRDVCVEGDGGILRSSPPWAKPEYEPSKRRLTWLSGPEAVLVSADEADRIRGIQGIAAWGDEIAVWPRLADAYSNLRFAVRLGPRPRICLTSTPRNRRELRDILAMPGTLVTKGKTRDNLQNLAPGVVAALERQYGGTRLGRQELDGELLSDNPGALWKLADIDGTRVESAPADLRRIVVAVDPAVTSRKDSDETGIVVIGVGQCMCSGEPAEHAFVLEDLSGIYTPDQWARTAVIAYRRHSADRIVAEVNQGGEMVENTIRLVDNNVAFKAVHATRGKAVRAEPVAALYEQHRVHHVGAAFSQLEDQLLGWDPVHDPWSPDRLDALVWGLTDLLVVDDSRSMFNTNWGELDEGDGGVAGLVSGFTSAEQGRANYLIATMGGGWRPGR